MIMIMTMMAKSDCEIGRNSPRNGCYFLEKLKEFKISEKKIVFLFILK